MNNHIIKTAMLAGLPGATATAVARRLSINDHELAPVESEVYLLAQNAAGTGKYPYAVDASTSDLADADITACLPDTGRARGADVDRASALFIALLHEAGEKQCRVYLAADLDSGSFTLHAYIGDYPEHVQAGADSLVSSVTTRVGESNPEAAAAWVSTTPKLNHQLDDRYPLAQHGRGDVATGQAFPVDGAVTALRPHRKAV